MILLAFVGANLPFANQRLFGVLPIGRPIKSIWLRLLELIAAYFAVGILGRVIESRLGNAFPQDWAFYAVTASLFLTFAFPTFGYQYLRRRR
ncbi:transmembrane lipoprotein [Pandoraea terrae]|uniref:Transmembrane lipoprotein n=1 Tax=Pandoraea terrae TaxID=1537710 RepID=A0A5E4Y1F4_9BURK|nr:transmembrane lipoprotein [Pandoraea terrae]